MNGIVTTYSEDGKVIKKKQKLKMGEVIRENSINFLQVQPF